MPLGGVLLDRAGIGMTWSERKTRKIARVEECAVPAAIAIHLACSREQGRLTKCISAQASRCVGYSTWLPGRSADLPPCSAQFPACGVLPTITVQGRRGRTQEPKERLAGTGPQLPDRPFRIFSLPHFPPSFCASSTPFSPLPFLLFSPHPLCSLCPSAPLAPVFLISPTPRLLPSPCPQSTSSLQPMSVALPLSLPHASLPPRGS